MLLLESSRFVRIPEQDTKAHRLRIPHFIESLLAKRKEASGMVLALSMLKGC